MQKACAALIEKHQFKVCLFEDEPGLFRLLCHLWEDWFSERHDTLSTDETGHVLIGATPSTSVPFALPSILSARQRGRKLSPSELADRARFYWLSKLYPEVSGFKSSTVPVNTLRLDCYNTCLVSVVVYRSILSLSSNHFEMRYYMMPVRYSIC